MRAIQEVLIMQAHAIIAALEEAPSDGFIDLLHEHADNSDSEEEKRIWEAMIDYINYLLH